MQMIKLRDDITGILISLKSFVEEPHTGICGINQGNILNMIAKEAFLHRTSIMNISREDPG